MDAFDRAQRFSNALTGGSCGVALVPASEIPTLPVIWLWKFWLARGKLHLLAGPPSTGKTTLALAVAAIVTNGGTALGTWPDGTAAPVGSVVVWSCEDGIEDTVKPRLSAAGADLRRALILYGGTERGRRRPFDFERDMPGLEAAVRARGDVALVIIDSIAQAVPASNNNSRIRKALSPMVEFAESTGAAVLGLTHLNKGSKKRDPLDRVNGSVAIGALARLVWVVARDESDGADGVSRNVLVRAKSNLGPSNGGFAYHIDQIDVPTLQGGAIHSTRIGWDGPLQGAPRDVLGDAEGGSAFVRDNRKQAAVDFLAVQLAHGPVPTKAIEAAAREAGFSGTTVRRAAGEMGVNKFRPIGTDHWYWRLDNRSPMQFDQPNSLSNFGEGGLPSGVPFLNAICSSWDMRNLPAGCPSQQVSYEDQLATPPQYRTPQNGEQVEQVEQVGQVGQVEQVEQVEQVGTRPIQLDPGELSHLIAEAKQEYRDRKGYDGEDEDDVVRQVIESVLITYFQDWLGRPDWPYWSEVYRRALEHADIRN
ncbi:energy-coupling factor transporter ATP-binding protein EcfA2 [Paraburkholderia sp. GAS206C]|uniref:AAA family ATPase n=1 Tax=unclassified Paraburkholderia TaxID=2615204 RepID=UPI003D24FFE4